jgi:hypothetical protein
VSYKQIKHYLESKHVTLVAVSKTKPPKAIMEIYDQGQRIFGENRVQELVEKFESLPKDIKWHLIGSLQKNKVKYIAPFVECIHSVDSLELAQVINKEALKNKRKIKCLLQIHIAQEETKHGFDPYELRPLLESGDLKNLPGISWSGLMGMASFVDDVQQVRTEFRSLRLLFKELKDKYFGDHPGFDQLSMGMSGDYDIAIEEGATMVRIGSAIFGGRS